MNLDVPSPIDLRVPEVASAWAESALAKRSWRTDFFARFEATLAGHTGRVLELGSGPGFLVEVLLPTLSPTTEYVMLDFSEAMHALARSRLAGFGDRVHFVCRSFGDPAWPEGLGHFSAVVTNQAVHELRHKSKDRALHEQVRAVLLLGGAYLVHDHFAGQCGMQDQELYMSVEEQAKALRSAGFRSVQELLRREGMVLHHAS